MANERNMVLERPNVTFYLYNKSDNKLRPWIAKLYIKHNIKSKWFESDSFTFHDPIWVEFEKWVYVLSLDKVGSELAYDQIYEFLSFYNNEWGKITKWSKENGTHIRNWYYFNAKDCPCYVSRENKVAEDEVKVKVVKEEVQVQTIPRRVAETLSFIQLKELCISWWINIPEKIEEEAGASNEMHDRYMNLLKDRLTD